MEEMCGSAEEDEAAAVEVNDEREVFGGIVECAAWEEYAGEGFA